jgi:hypothetical protein
VQHGRNGTKIGVLTHPFASAKQEGMKMFLLPTVLLALAACDTKPETIVVEPPDFMKEEMANAAPVTLPPPVSASVTFRCKDNSLAYVDFFDGSFVNFRADKAAPPTRLEATTPGEAYGTGDTTVSGTPTSVSVTRPGKPTQTCTA